LPEAGNRVVVAGAALKRQLVPEVAIEKTGRLLQAAHTDLFKWRFGLDRATG